MAGSAVVHYAGTDQPENGQALRVGESEKKLSESVHGVYKVHGVCRLYAHTSTHTQSLAQLFALYSALLLFVVTTPIRPWEHSVSLLHCSRKCIITSIRLVFILAAFAIKG